MHEENNNNATTITWKTCAKLVISALAEPAICDAEVGTTFQFLRMGYFCKDPDSTPEKPVYNRTVSLKDSWAKEQKKN